MLNDSLFLCFIINNYDKITIMKKSLIYLLLLFIMINSAIYVLSRVNAEQRIRLVLDDNLNTLKTHYEILLHTQKITASTLYRSTIESDRVLAILSQAQDATEAKKVLLRDELQLLLTSKYERAKEKGVLQYHFVLANNESFLRMHKPGRSGDDLTTVRDDLAYTNATQQAVRGFTQGKTAHGFRNVFPLFDTERNHIGAMEISFSSDSFQWYLNNISNIHTHFLVNRDIFDAKTWERDDLILKYSQSAEHVDHMITLGDIHTKEKCIVENREKLVPIREEIDLKIRQGDMFSSYVRHQDHIDVISFLPIRDLKEKTVAWLVSFEESPFIAMTLKGRVLIRILTLLLSSGLIYFLVQQIRSNKSIERKRQLLDDILNATDNIMFITDFKDVSFSNDKFKDLFEIKEMEEFNERNHHDLLSVFLQVDGYLHAGLLKEGEDPIALIEDTAEDERIVSILSGDFEAKAFQVSISKTNSDDDYLVTLSDITKMKEKHVATQKKAYFDGLTGVYNRNRFDETFDEELVRVKRYGDLLTMALIDIDRFKVFNDTHGHLIGDEVLRMMAQSVDQNIKQSDTFARWGGEEFVILFKETSVEDAKRAAERLREEIARLRHPSAGGITASFGLTQYIEGDTISSMFKRCDEALYKAKASGRNRVEIL